MKCPPLFPLLPALLMLVVGCATRPDQALPAPKPVVSTKVLDRVDPPDADRQGPALYERIEIAGKAGKPSRVAFRRVPEADLRKFCREDDGVTVIPRGQANFAPALMPQEVAALTAEAIRLGQASEAAQARLERELGEVRRLAYGVRQNVAKQASEAIQGVADGGQGKGGEKGKEQAKEAPPTAK